MQPSGKLLLVAWFHSVVNQTHSSEFVTAPSLLLRQHVVTHHRQLVAITKHNIAATRTARERLEKYVNCTRSTVTSLFTVQASGDDRKKST
jgi:hypothetical protein